MQMPGIYDIEHTITNCGIKHLEKERYFIQDDLEDKFLYCGKHDPELYFDAQIRSGISSFSDLSNKTEVNQGLSELRKDVKSGKVKKVMAKFENDFGDYLYVVGKKHNRQLGIDLIFVPKPWLVP